MSPPGSAAWLMSRSTTASAAAAMRRPVRGLSAGSRWRGSLAAACQRRGGDELRRACACAHAGDAAAAGFGAADGVFACWQRRCRGHVALLEAGARAHEGVSSVHTDASARPAPRTRSMGGTRSGTSSAVRKTGSSCSGRSQGRRRRPCAMCATAGRRWPTGHLRRGLRRGGPDDREGERDQTEEGEEEEERRDEAEHSSPSASTSRCALDRLAAAPRSPRPGRQRRPRRAPLGREDGRW